MLWITTSLRQQRQDWQKNSNTCRFWADYHNLKEVRSKQAYKTLVKREREHSASTLGRFKRLVKKACARSSNTNQKEREVVPSLLHVLTFPVLKPQQSTKSEDLQSALNCRTTTTCAEGGKEHLKENRRPVFGWHEWASNASVLGQFKYNLGDTVGNLSFSSTTSILVIEAIPSFLWERGVRVIVPRGDKNALTLKHTVPSKCEIVLFKVSQLHSARVMRNVERGGPFWLTRTPRVLVPKYTQFFSHEAPFIVLQ